MMRLDELTTLDENFEEHEKEALNALPHNEKGLAELLDYLDGMDSYEAWRYLFEEYDDIMSEELFDEMREKANALFDNPFFKKIEHINRTKLVWLPKEEGEKAFMLTVGNSECLILFEMEEWSKYTDYLWSLPRDNKDVRALWRRVLGNAMQSCVREDGAIVIPEYLHCLCLAEEENVTVYEMSDYLEKMKPEFIFGKEYAKYVIAVEE